MAEKGRGESESIAAKHISTQQAGWATAEIRIDQHKSSHKMPSLPELV